MTRSSTTHEALPCCIACGRDFLALGTPIKALDEREEWKYLRDDYPCLVKAEEIESMYFHKRPWLWTCFYRTIIHSLHGDYISISGINQTILCCPPNERLILWDREKACIGWLGPNSEASPYTRFHTADMLDPQKIKTAPHGQIGYPIHAHCWVLVDRIIGFGLVEVNKKIFLKAIKQFWTENPRLWLRAPWRNCGYEVDSDPDPVPDFSGYTSEPESESHEPYALPVWENPVIVPRVQEIIEQATLSQKTESNSRQSPPSVVSQIPLDIAIQIVEFTKRASTTDTRNLLAAFRWRLPDNYWKSCCNMDLIFEYDDLQKTNIRVDWQIIGLATEELMEDPDWERNTGLGTRRWIFHQLEQIKTRFLDFLERVKTEPGLLDEPFPGRYHLRKRFL